MTTEIASIRGMLRGAIGIAFLIGCWCAPSISHAQPIDPGYPVGSQCLARTEGWLEPRIVMPGEGMLVTTRITFTCPQDHHAYNLVVVADRTAVEDAEGRPGTASILRELPAALDLAHNPDVRIGVVAYDREAELVCGLRGDPDSAEACLSRVGPPAAESAPGGQALGPAIGEAQKALILGRPSAGEAAGPSRREGILVIALPPGAEAIARAAEAAVEARANGIELEIVDLAATAGDGTLAPLASEGRSYGAQDWPHVLADQADLAWATQLRIRTGAVHEFLSRDVIPRPETADPTETGYDPVRHVLQWPLQLDGQDSIQLSYTAVSYRSGTQPLRTVGYGVFRDTHGLRGSFMLPEPTIVVADGRIVQLFVPTAQRFDTGGIKTLVGED